MELDFPFLDAIALIALNVAQMIDSLASRPYNCQLFYRCRGSDSDVLPKGIASKDGAIANGSIDMP